MTWKFWVLFAILIAVAVNPKSSYAEETDEDIEETSELVANHIAPLLELNGLTLADLPDQLKYLTAKYYLIFSRGVEPLDTLEKMIDDYIIIQNSQHIMVEDFDEYIEQFVEVNKSNNKRVLEKFVTKILGSFNFSLQVVSPKDAVKFLLYQEAYPDIMELISLMVGRHYEAYLTERAKEKKDPRQPSNHRDNDKDEDMNDYDLIATIREFVAVHGRLELIKRMLSHFEQYLPPVDQENINETTLEYLDNLQDYIEMKSNHLWGFLKGSSYTTKTDEWIKGAEELLRDFLTIIPFEEILNFFDALALNSNDRRAVIIIRYERSLSRSDELSNKVNPPLTVANARDIFDYIWEAVFNGFASIHEIVQDMGVNSEVSQKAFLDYIDELLSPYDLSTNDLSKEMISIISRSFMRIKSIEGQSLSDAEKKILQSDTQSFRKNLEKLRDSLRILTPEKNESNHIELETMLQTVVNKYGAFALQMEAILVQFFNIRLENPGDKKIVEEDISKFAQQLDDMTSIFKNSGKKPSESLKERLSELVQIIDGLVVFSSF